MKTLQGKLEFISLWDKIKLTNETGEIDLRDCYFKLFEQLNGKKTRMEQDKNSIDFIADETADRVINYLNDGERIGISLESEDKVSWSNIGAYLACTLQTLNGRDVIVRVDETGIKISNSPNEKVMGLYYTDGNTCKIPDDKVKEVCKIGTNDCCIFCSAGAKGFSCLKFDTPSARMLLYRYSKKEMNASRIGDCAILGRNETL